MGMSPLEDMSVALIVSAMVLVFTQVSLSDLLVEARYAKLMHDIPKLGPDLMVFVWGGIHVGSVFSVCLTGTLIQAAGPQWPSAGDTVLPSPILNSWQDHN